MAFSNWDAVLNNLDRTSCPTCSNGIESYALYWVLSLLDYYQYTNDTQALEKYIPTVQRKLDHAISLLENPVPPSLSFFGGDERQGDYFEDPDIPENQLSYRFLSVRVLTAFSSVLLTDAWLSAYQSIGTHYAAVAQQLISAIRNETGHDSEETSHDSEETGHDSEGNASSSSSSSAWYANLGMHSAADAINANFTEPQERAAMFALYFNDSLQITSFTPFNNYFILQALGVMQKWDEACAFFSLSSCSLCIPPPLLPILLLPPPPPPLLLLLPPPLLLLLLPPPPPPFFFFFLGLLLPFFFFFLLLLLPFFFFFLRLHYFFFALRLLPLTLHPSSSSVLCT